MAPKWIKDGNDPGFLECSWYMTTCYGAIDDSSDEGGKVLWDGLENCRRDLIQRAGCNIAEQDPKSTPDYTLLYYIYYTYCIVWHSMFCTFRKKEAKKKPEKKEATF